jgi:hypothetical protein
MSDFERFLKTNRVVKENVFYPATSAVTDENGEPVLWEIRHLTTTQCEEIKRECIRQIEGKNGVVRERLDTNGYMDRLLAASVVEPNLYNAELQDSYGVYTPEELLKAIIDNPAEYAAFADYVYGLLGFTTFGEKVEQAKN